MYIDWKIWFWHKQKKSNNKIIVIVLEITLADLSKNFSFCYTEERMIWEYARYSVPLEERLLIISISWFHGCYDGSFNTILILSLSEVYYYWQPFVAVIIIFLCWSLSKEINGYIKNEDDKPVKISSTNYN